MSLTNPLVTPIPGTLVGVNAERRSVDPVVPDPEFEVAIDAELQRIWRSRVGRDLIGAITRHWVIISPRDNAPTDGFAKSFGAAVTVAWRDRDAVAKHERPRAGSGSRHAQIRTGMAIPGAAAGTGIGSQSVMYYDLAQCRVHLLRTDGVLVHELAHGLRNSWGESLGRPGGTLPLPRRYAYPTDEEFFAQVMVNMYLVENMRAPIVGYHGRAEGIRADQIAPGRVPMGRSASLRDDTVRKLRQFEQTHLRTLVRRAVSMSTVFASFARLDVPYNPFRDIDDRNARVYWPG